MRLARFLLWTGSETRVFNVGQHRRTTETGVQDAAYFDPNSAAMVARREKLALEVIEEMLHWLEGGEERFAIFDATNTTKARRHKIAETLRRNRDLNVIFVESVCTDSAVLEANIAQKLSKSPDYARMPQAEARADLRQRV